MTCSRPRGREVAGRAGVSPPPPRVRCDLVCASQVTLPLCEFGSPAGRSDLGYPGGRPRWVTRSSPRVSCLTQAVNGSFAGRCGGRTEQASWRH